MPLISMDFEVISIINKKERVFTIQRADFTRKWLITVFGLFQISLINSYAQFSSPRNGT